MKAIIADIQASKMVLMCENGDFQTVRTKKGAVIGQEISFRPSSYRTYINIPQVRVGLAAACLFLVMGTGVWGYYIPNEYINIDINPSVEIVTNYLNRVIKIEALNEDGENILTNTNYNNQDYELAVGKIIESACEKNYIKDNQDNAVMLTVTSNNTTKNETAGKVLKEKVEKVTSLKNSPTVIETNSIPVTKYQEAKDINLSPGKLLLLERLKEVDPEANIADVKNVRVKDIIDTIKEKRRKNLNKENEIKKEISEDERAKADNSAQKHPSPSVTPPILPKSDLETTEKADENKEKTIPKFREDNKNIKPSLKPNDEINEKRWNSNLKNKMRERIINRRNKAIDE